MFAVRTVHVRSGWSARSSQQVVNPVALQAEEIADFLTDDGSRPNVFCFSLFYTVVD